LENKEISPILPILLILPADADCSSGAQLVGSQRDAQLSQSFAIIRKSARYRPESLLGRIFRLKLVWLAMWAVVMSSPNFIGDSAIQLRRRLPQRRFHELLDFEHAGYRYTAGLGFFETGGLAEIFINVPGRSGSAIEAVARDAAILTSICLQYGASVATIRHALTRNSDGSAGGPLGVVLDLLAPASDRPRD
jgi:hypothetical protein